MRKHELIVVADAGELDEKRYTARIEVDPVLAPKDQINYMPLADLEDVLRKTLVKSLGPIFGTGAGYLIARMLTALKKMPNSRMTVIDPDGINIINTIIKFK